MNVEKWLDENAVATETAWYNGINYLFATLKDGWIGIFERDNGRLIPLIQAADMEHAKSYCYFREPVKFPIEVIA